jgi:hypothetical protein
MVMVALAPLILDTFVCMPAFEEIKPTDLLKRTRDRDVPGNDPLVLGANNFAYFLRPYIEGQVENLRRQTRDGASFDGGIVDIVEIVKTGIQLAFEHQVDILDTILPSQDPAARDSSF